MINKVILSGSISGRDPELSYLDSGKAMCKFNLAVSYYVGKVDGKPTYETNFYNCVCWGAVAERTGVLHWHQKLLVVGRLRLRKYVDKNCTDTQRNERLSPDITVDDVELLLDKKRESESQDDGSSFLLDDEL